MKQHYKFELTKSSVHTSWFKASRALKSLVQPPLTPTCLSFSSRFRTLRNLFGSGFYKNNDSNRVSGVYEMYLKMCSESSSPGVQRRQRRVLDTSSTYVRGEENLNGWQPRGDSLIFDHQWELEKLTRLQLVEKTRHTLLLREKLSEQNKTHELSKLDKEASNMFVKAKRERAKKEELKESSDDKTEEKWEKADNNTEKVKPGQRQQLIYDFSTDGDVSKELIAKCLQLMLQGRLPLSPPPVRTPMTESVISTTSPSDESDGAVSGESLVASMSSSTTSELFKATSSNPNELPLSKSCESFGTTSSSEGGAPDRKMSLPVKPIRTDIENYIFVPDLEEVCVSPVVSRKGYLNFLEEKTSGWVKRWVVVRRPFVYIYNSEKDPVERGIINLATAQIEYSEDQQALLKTRNAFSVMTKYRGFLIQTLDDKDFHDWLYAINPLLAGQIRSKLSRRKQDVTI
ncbi:hypothetical protein ScPMuIL_009183 [Solemya velum]